MAKNNNTKTILIVIGITFTILIGIPMFLLFFLGIIIASSGEIQPSGNVALIKINGVILTDSGNNMFGIDGTTSTWVTKKLNKISKDDSIDAVIFEINSPGGSGVAADEIARSIQKLDKPNVAYIRDTGASAAYWIASATDRIYVNRLSFVGSIGVIASYLDFSETIDDYNISYQRFVAGDNKDFGSPFRKVTKQEESKFQAQLDEMHDIFIEEVAKGRNMEFEEVKALADGSIYTGTQSVENGLADDIGGLNDAISYLEEQGIVVDVVDYSPKSPFAEIFGQMNAHSFEKIGYGLGLALSEKNEKSLLFQN